MGDVIDFNKYKKAQIIELTDEDALSVIECFLDVDINYVFILDDDYEVMGYTATFDHRKEQDADCVENAWLSWDACFRGKVFSDKLSIALSFADCLMESKEILNNL